MSSEQKQPYKIFRVGGRRFEIFCEYDSTTGESCPVFPDFEEHPEYTAEGRPFTTADRDDCPYCKSKTPGEEPPGDCGGCAWFNREESPQDVIGVCMCDSLLARTIDQSNTNNCLEK